NFALSMMLEPAMLAPVLSQPSLPLARAGGMHIAPDELAAVKQRLRRGDLTGLAHRFAGRSFGRPGRFSAHHEALADPLRARVLPDSAAKPNAPMKSPSSVGTLHLIDEQNQPTRQAVDEILGFFKTRLM